jgi:hypothetical protein
MRSWFLGWEVRLFGFCFIGALFLLYLFGFYFYFVL